MKSAVKFLMVAFLGIFTLAAWSDAQESASNLVEELDARNARTVDEKVLTSGQPSEADFKKLAESGVTTVVNLRGTDEFDDFDEKALAESLGLEYVSIPITSGDDLNKENANKLNQILSGADGKTLLHCGSGNRAGALLALDAYYNDGATTEEALALGDKAGLTSEGLRARIESITSEDSQ